MACCPLVALEPVQPPEAVQDVAFCDDQAIAVELPEVMVAGFTLSVTTGAEAGGGDPPGTGIG